MIRHGQTVGYDRQSVYGATDAEVTEVGILQMQNLVERLRLAEIGAIYSSDLKRSVTGARILASRHNVPLHALPELREIDFGEWEGLTLSEIRERFPGELDQRKSDLIQFQPPGPGESIEHLSRRVGRCMGRILKEERGKDILFVGHGMVNRVILCNAMELDLSRLLHLQQDYGCLNIIDYFSDTAVVRLMNG